MRSNDKIKSSIRSFPLPVKFPSTVLRGLKYRSIHTACDAVTSIVIFTIHETVMSEPIRSVHEGETSIETAKKNVEQSRIKCLYLDIKHIHYYEKMFTFELKLCT